MATEENKLADEAQIRQLIDNWVRAFRSMDLTGILSLYAPDIVSFDLVPPLRYAGADEYRKPWEETFRAYQSPLDYEIHDLNITVSENLAFTHSINRMRGRLKNGEQTDLWLRWTACFRKIDGKWLITHEHVSVPVDPGSGKAMLDLSP